MLLSVVAYALLTLVATTLQGLIAVIPLISGSLFGGLIGVASADLINLQVKSKNRATILSAESLVNNLGLAIASPIFGYLAGVYNINFVFMLGAAIALVVAFTMIFLRNQMGQQTAS